MKGESMLIKITEINDSELGSYDAKEIVGDRVDGQGEWRKKCFANDQQLMAELAEFGVGEIVNVKLKKGKGTNKYGKPNYNIDSFEEADEDLVKAVKANPSGKSSGASGSSGSFKSGRSGEAYDRSAAIYLAVDVLKHNNALNTKKTAQFITEKEIFELAVKFNAYIHDGDDGSDPLDPPEIS
jgi:hypothetical protein